MRCKELEFLGIGRSRWVLLVASRAAGDESGAQQWAECIIRAETI